MLKVYLAGPDVFLPDAIEIGRRKKELCARYGFEGLDPFDNEISSDNSKERLDLLIYRANVRMIRDADFGIMNLTPFRGPSADAGTVFELGMLIGLSKPAFGYSNVTSDMLSRVKDHMPTKFDTLSRLWRDANGMTIEDFGNTDNLMIEAALMEQGHPIVRHSARSAERFRDLSGFEECLRRAAKEFLRSTMKSSGRLAQADR